MHGPVTRYMFRRNPRNYNEDLFNSVHFLDAVNVFQFNSQSHINKYSVARESTFAARTKHQKPAPASPPSGEAQMQKNVNNNSMKIAAALKDRGDAPSHAGEDSDDGGFASPTRPYAKGLRRQGSAVVGRRTEADHMRGRQYRSYRHTRTQRSSHV